MKIDTYRLLFFFTIFLFNKIGISQCNVALNKPATASGNYYTSPPSGAFDGNKTTNWSVAAYTGWIQVDLQGTYEINKINLLVDQTPNGNTTHKIYSAPSILGPWTLVETISGYTSINQLLTRTYTNPLQNIGALKFETTLSPSWVAWYEIEVFSNTTATITPQSNTNFCQGNSVALNATSGSNYTYEWYKNGTLINGASTSTYTATTAGNYTVKVIDGSCNATSSATTLTLIDTLTWTGNVDNDWHKPCNWSPEIVPECCNSVKIPLTTNSPVVSGVAKAKNVNVYSTSGATLTVNNGANLQIETCPVTKTENSCPTLPVLTTTVISNTTQTAAVSGGNITYAGSSSITARGVCWSTTTSPTIANSKTTDGSGVGSFTSNISGLTAGTTYYVRAYATNASGTSYGNEVSFIAVNPQPAYPVGSVFCNGTPTLVVDVTNPTTGKTWMDRNLGATQAATSSTDVNAYGDLYQWGRGSDGHQCRNSATTTTLSSTDQPGHGKFIIVINNPIDWRSSQNNNLWQGLNGINNPCPQGYRLPSEIELDSEISSWNSKNTNGAFLSPLKFSLSGARVNYSGLLSSVGTNGGTWSSTINTIYSRRVDFSSSNGNIVTDGRSGGCAVRCIKN